MESQLGRKVLGFDGVHSYIKLFSLFFLTNVVAEFQLMGSLWRLFYTFVFWHHIVFCMRRIKFSWLLEFRFVSTVVKLRMCCMEF